MSGYEPRLETVYETDEGETMTAKRTPRIRTEGRTILQDAIPLDTPIHMFIDPSAACNFKCRFCFHSDKRNTHHEIMKRETFMKIVDQLKEFPHKLKAIRVYGFGEPLLNKRLPDMIRVLKESGVTDFVEFTTNGWWLNPERNAKLIASGVDAITVSVPGLNDKRMFESSGKHVDSVEYFVNLVDLCKQKKQCRIHIKLTNYHLSQTAREIFYLYFENFCDEISIDNIVPIWNGIDGQQIDNKDIYGGDLHPVKVCPYIFYHLTVMADGSISTCFVDWERKNILGNVYHNTLKNVWNGLQLHEMRVNHLKGRGDIYPLCKGCRQLIFGCADNIDPHAEKILEKIT
jgi:MoaA/NifB/PqqE/SkfB family radical SAM enzyme